MLSLLKREWHFILAIAFMFLLGKVIAAYSQDEYIDVALVLVQDVSQSMAEEMPLVQGAYAQAFAHPEVVRAIQLGNLGRIAVAYVEFHSNARLRLNWRIISTAEEAADFGADIAALPIQEGELRLTNISEGLLTALDLLERAPAIPTRMVIDVVGDGKQNMEFTTGPARVRAELVERGVQINALVMNDHASEPDVAFYYETQVAGGPGGFSIAIHDPGDMQVALTRKLIAELY